MILTNTKERNRFVKFALVGTLGAVIDFGVMNLLSHYTDMPLVYAGTISFTGSTRAGKRVSGLAAQSVKRVALELGGNNATLNTVGSPFSFNGTVPITTLIQTIFGGLATFPLLAIPLFMLAGNLMNAGGITPENSPALIAAGADVLTGGDSPAGLIGPRMARRNPSSG